MLTKFVTYICVCSTAVYACVYTYADHTGNRLAPGRSTFPLAKSYDLRHPESEGLDGRPKKVPITWVTGSEGTNGTIHWFATDSDMKIWTFEQKFGDIPRYKAVMKSPMVPFLANFPFDFAPDTSTLTHPVCIPNQRLLYVSTSGDLVLMNSKGDQLARQPVNALLDARLVLNRDRSLVALYTAANQSQNGYVHGVLGDSIEGASVAILRTANLEPVREIKLSDENVIFEGLSPMWVDLDEDGREEILTTISDRQVGAAMFAFDLNGRVLARSDPIGRGHRWRHQLAVAKFGPQDEPELAAVHTPHLGQVVEFFRLEGDRLLRTTSRPGYTSHVFGSRNLDMATAGDFDGDGKPELVVPSNSRYRIVGLRHMNDDYSGQSFVKEMWEFWLGQKVTSNIATVQLEGGYLAMGVGLEDGSLRVFTPVHDV